MSADLDVAYLGQYLFTLKGAATLLLLTLILLLVVRIPI
jgi:hypothetical protein